MTHMKFCNAKEAKHQVKWFKKLTAVPTNIKLVPGGYEYDFVYGECPVPCENIPQLLKFCERELWSRGATFLPINATEYFDYVEIVARQMGVNISGVLKRGRTFTFTPVKNCHGDLTLENVVMKNDSFVFIDPGFTRGLPCRELDESKILQWQEECGDEPFSYSQERVVLLATHYVRLLRHANKHHPSRVLFARRRIDEINQTFI